ncbi:MAG: hypothetical protein EOR95_33090 [Mesorhizobium sp.]|nr:MAG: hypothetical protein EOR95_33090 [Mesorhizobium sp.]
MSRRPKHPNKEIESAISELESLGWSYQEAGKSSHAWGRMLCPQHDRSGCQVSVWSTPRVPENHAKQLIGHGKKCAHEKEGGKNEDV